MKCPNCENGKIHGVGCPGFRTVTIDCDICKGTGELSHNIIFVPEKGLAMKKDRKHRGLSIREAAKSLNILPSELCRQESGYFTCGADPEDPTLTFTWETLGLQAWDNERKMWCAVYEVNVSENTIGINTGVVTVWRNLDKTELRIPMMNCLRKNCPESNPAAVSQ